MCRLLCLEATLGSLSSCCEFATKMGSQDSSRQSYTLVPEWADCCFKVNNCAGFYILLLLKFLVIGVQSERFGRDCRVQAILRVKFTRYLS